MIDLGALQGAARVGLLDLPNAYWMVSENPGDDPAFVR